MLGLGRIIGVVLGWYIYGFLGALFGFAVGHYFDRARQKFQASFNPEMQAQIETVMFKTIFPLLGQLAKSDGRVSEEEIATAETLMRNMRLSDQACKEAIALFQQGVSQGFNVDSTLEDFNKVCGHHHKLKQMLLMYLLSLALADNTLQTSEEQLLRRIAEKIGYGHFAFEQILRMAKAQQHFHSNSEQYQRAQNTLNPLKMSWN